MTARANELTILLPLRGRHLHTLRYLWHAERTRLPYHVIVADGLVHPTIDRLLSDPKTFPNLSFEYRRYDDHSYSAFYAKCADMMQCVQTKYAMMSDNDDFLFPAGLERSLAFLEGHPDYIAAGGAIPGFSVGSHRSVQGKVVGRLERLSIRCADAGYSCIDVVDATASARVLNEMRRYQSVYYHAVRIEALRTITKELVALDFSDLSVHEYYWGYRMASLGKIRTDPAQLNYFRQAGTSTNPRAGVDWVDHLLRSHLPQDYTALADAIAREAAHEDGTSAERLREQILEHAANQLRNMLANTMLRHRFPRLFEVKQKLLRIPVPRKLPSMIQRELDRKRLWQHLSAKGIESALQTTHANELSRIESTLRGDDFLVFARETAPELLV